MRTLRLSVRVCAIAALIALAVAPHAAVADVSSDTQAPQLVSLSRTPTSVDVGSTYRDVTFTIQASDDLSGIDAFLSGVNLISPTGVFATDVTPLTLVSGNSAGGTATYTQTLRVPKSGEAGTWSVSVGFFDVAGHIASISSSNLTSMGLPNSVAVANTYTLTYTLIYTAGSGGAIIGNSSQAVVAGGSGTAVTAVPNIGYHFVGWSDGGLDAVRQDMNVTANHTISATFEVNAGTTFTITGSAGTGGSLSISGATVVKGGSNLTVIVTPDAGYEIASVTVDGVAEPLGSVTFANIAANHTVSATFVPTTKLTINANPTTLKLGVSAHFFGVIAPNMPDRTPIRLMVRKSGQLNWTNVVPYVRTYSAQRWSFYYHPNTRGTYYFKVQFAATATHLGATSRTIRLVWK
jgi:Divergent InlB B-repeat domain